VLDALAADLGREVWLSERADSPDRDSLRFAVPGADTELVVRRTAHALSVDEQAAIQQGLAVLGIEAGQREAVRQTHRRFAAELFELAREADAQAGAIAERLRGLGLDPDGGLIAIVCDSPDAALGRFEDALRAAGLRAVATVRTGRLVAVAEWAVQHPTDALAAGLAQAMGDEYAVGIGSAVAHCALLDASVGDARRACRLARLRQDASHSATAALLRSHAGLLAQQDPDVLDHFCRELLDPLLEHDAERGSELVGTLATFLGSGRRWAATADALHVHVNTLRHRLGRIEALTGRSLDDPGDGVDFHLALRARGLLR
jgi:hypothetical protein